MSTINLAMRFVLELAGVAAIAYWGYEAAGPLPLRIGFAVGAAAAVIVFWALIVAPKADNAIPADVRILIGSAVLLVAAWALALAGQPTLALVLGAAVVVNTALLFVLGHDVPASFARGA